MRVVTISAALNNRSVSNFLGEVIVLMAREAEIVAGFLKQPFFVRGVRIVAAGAANPLFGRVFERRVEFNLLKFLFLRRMTSVAELRAFLLQDHGADDAMTLVTGFAFTLTDRSVNKFLRRISGDFLLMAIAARTRGKAAGTRLSRERNVSNGKGQGDAQ